MMIRKHSVSAIDIVALKVSSSGQAMNAVPQRKLSLPMNNKICHCSNVTSSAHGNGRNRALRGTILAETSIHRDVHQEKEMQVQNEKEIYILSEAIILDGQSVSHRQPQERRQARRQSEKKNNIKPFVLQRAVLVEAHCVQRRVIGRIRYGTADSFRLCVGGEPTTGVPGGSGLQMRGFTTWRAALA